MRNNLSIVLLITSLSFIVSCSSSSNAAKPKEVSETMKVAMKDHGYRCDKVISVGSNIKKKRCSTKRMRDVQREASKNTIESMQGGGVRAGDGS